MKNLKENSLKKEIIYKCSNEEVYIYKKKE